MPVGLYIHVPFCVSKCPYCDFYSLPLQAHDDRLDRYTAAVERALAHWAGQLCTAADTLYFGGGTPSLLGGARLARLIETAARLFSLDGAEITLEANPADAEPGGASPLRDTLRDFAAAGGNRLSLGMQSASGEELRLLGRRHGPEAVLHTVEAARKAGIDNISLDLMLGIEGQDESSLLRSVERCAALGAAHVSAYLLKIEEGTPFGQRRDSLRLPGEDETAACISRPARRSRRGDIGSTKSRISPDPAGKAAITSNIGTPGPISVSDRRPIPASGDGGSPTRGTSRLFWRDRIRNSRTRGPSGTILRKNISCSACG